MRTIAIINQKGGCGKTTVSVNLAAVLASMGRKTLLVDMDPQSHCALGLAVPETQLDKSILDVLRAGLDGSIGINDVCWQISHNLDLVPSSMGLAGLEQELANAPDKDRRLAQVLSTVDDLYEFCIVDCPPSIGLLTFNALRASHEVMIPVETGYFALQGSLKQEATIEMLARRANHHARFRVLATMYDVRTKLAREVLGELRRHFGDKLLPVVVHFNAKLKEAASFGQAISEYDPASTGSQDFEQLAQWLIAHPPEPSPVRPGLERLAAAANAAGVPGDLAVSPAGSRAAELVERARQLSARAAALSARMGAAEGRASGENSESENNGQGHSIVVADEPESPSRQSNTAVATAKPVRQLAEKLAKLYGVRPTSHGMLFLQPIDTAAEMAIAGDFNNWAPTPMRRDDVMGVWQTVVALPPGRYRYRLVADGKWVPDPFNTYVESNPFGELNNIIEVG